MKFDEEKLKKFHEQLDKYEAGWPSGHMTQRAFMQESGNLMRKFIELLRTITMEEPDGTS